MLAYGAESDRVIGIPGEVCLVNFVLDALAFLLKCSVKCFYYHLIILQIDSELLVFYHMFIFLLFVLDIFRIC